MPEIMLHRISQPCARALKGTTLSFAPDLSFRSFIYILLIIIAGSLIRGVLVDAYSLIIMEAFYLLNSPNLKSLFLFSAMTTFSASPVLSLSDRCTQPVLSLFTLFTTLISLLSYQSRPPSVLNVHKLQEPLAQHLVL